MALVIRPDGSREYLDTNGKSIQDRLALFKHHVGGPLEAAPADAGGFVLFHHDGKGLQLPRNQIASDQVSCFLMENDYIAGVAVLATAEEVHDHEPPFLHPTAGKSTVVVVCVDREGEIEAGYIESTLARLSMLTETPDAVLAYEGCLTITIDGYNDDPRELRNIPEVRAWFAKLNAAWPYWSWFASRTDETLKLVFELLLPGADTTKDELGLAGWQVPPNSIRELIFAMFRAQNQLVAAFGIDEAANKDATDDFASAIATFIV